MLHEILSKLDEKDRYLFMTNMYFNYGIRKVLEVLEKEEK